MLCLPLRPNVVKNTASRTVIDSNDGHTIKEDPCSFGGFAAEAQL